MISSITKDIIYVGVNDHDVDLFEGQYIVPNGMAYNSYVIMDERIAVMDTVDAHFGEEWLSNVKEALNGREPDYLVVQHMEPDHSANIVNFIAAHPNAKIVGNAKTFAMIADFFDITIPEENKVAVANGESLSLGAHQLTFVFAPMVHWPEVMVTYDAKDKVLFSADGFGKFGALDIAIICPLHGPALKDNLAHYINLYDIWSSYRAESEGVMIAYTSVYGHTKAAAELLNDKLNELGCKKVVLCDLARCDMAEAVEDAFRYGKLVLATTTYNADIFPFMRTFIEHLTERNYQNRTVGFIENGAWAPMAAKVMRAMLEKSKDITYLPTTVTIKSALKSASIAQIEQMAKELM